MTEILKDAATPRPLPCPFCGETVKRVGIFGNDGIEHPENDCYLRGRVAYTEAWSRRALEDALKEKCERYEAALKNLANEAAGFLSMADPSNYGNTNMHVMALRIDEAKSSLATPIGRDGEKADQSKREED